MKSIVLFALIDCPRWQKRGLFPKGDYSPVPFQMVESGRRTTRVVWVRAQLQDTDEENALHRARPRRGEIILNSFMVLP